MNLENNAKLVHELAKSPNSSSVLPQLESIRTITNSENDAITKVFSKVESSDDSLETGSGPDVYWA